MSFRRTLGLTLRRLQWGVCTLALAVPVAAAHAQVTTYRFTDLDLRDPHVFVSFIGCRDVTNTPIAGYSVNGSLQSSIQADGNGDGRLDRNHLLIFNPLAPSSPTGGVLGFRTADCTAPMSGTTCSPDASAELRLAYTHASSGQCLAPIAGTTTAYTPSITAPSVPCFATAIIPAWTVDLGGIPLPLQNVQIAATYSGIPPGTLTNGLIRGFLTETVANNTTIPASFPVIGGKKVAALLPGGGSCATHDARDMLNGVRGWWFYLNFTAAPVTYTGGVTGVDATPGAASVRAFPNPFGPSVSIRFSVPEPQSVRVTVVDALGREVKRIADGWLAAGPHEMKWDGRDERGSRAAAGVYFLRVARAGDIATRRVVLVP
jgi:hypothetical protein